MKRYIVTGGLGHIGSHVVDELIKRGHEVLIIDNLSTGKTQNKNKKAKLLRASVTEVLENRKISAKKWDCLIHLAAFGNVRAGSDDPLKARQSGANLTVAALEMCKRYGIGKFVFVSSVVVEFNPHIPYGIEKDMGEKYALYYQKRFGVDVSIIRLHNVFGSWRHDISTGNVIPAFLEQAKKQGKIQITGDGSQVRDFVYYKDAVSAILTAERKRGITEVGSCKGHTILEVARMFNCTVEFIGRPHGEVDVQLCKKSDYKITIPFEVGMKRVLASVRVK